MSERAILVAMRGVAVSVLAALMIVLVFGLAVLVGAGSEVVFGLSPDGSLWVSIAFLVVALGLYVMRWELRRWR